MENNTFLKNLKTDVLVFDIETSSFDSFGSEINIRTNFDEYVDKAVVKWFGAYSYKTKQSYYINCCQEPEKAKKLLDSHKILVGFNSEEFDYPIIVNNGYTNLNIRYLNVDCMQILGPNNKINRKGYAFKNRGPLMKYSFKNTSLKHIAEVMKLECQKGDIDYKIFAKNNWDEVETKEIIKYLHNDVMATKQMFDKLWSFWMPFTKLIPEQNIVDLSWIRSSISSLTYKAACYSMDVKPTYGETTSKKEEMGGRVIEPKYEEQKDVWYVDFASLYPHIMCMFNLFNEQPKSDKLWHGNEMFEVRGYYDISNIHSLSKSVKARIKERMELKKNSPNDPMEYALKTYINSLYGIVRSAIFEKVHTPNAGWDCCWLGQQIHKYTEKRLKDFGFETIYGDSVSRDTPVLIRINNQTQFVPIEDLFIAPLTNTNKRCVVKNVKIWTDNGWSLINYVYRHKTNKIMYRIATRKGFIEVSQDHSLMINNNKVSPKDLKIGDCLELINYKLNNKYDIDKDLCWLLGFWLAEGSTGYYKYKSGVKYCWALHQKEIQPLKKAQEILLKYGLNTKILNTLKSSNCNRLVPDSKNIKVFYELFKEWCLTKLNDKKIPSFILNSNLQSKKMFLEGYLDGDGSVDKKDGSVSFCSIDKSLFTGLCHIVSALGHDYSLKIRKDKLNVMSARIIRNSNDKRIHNPNQILKIEKYKSSEHIYDIETENHHFCGGVGNINLHNTDSVMCCIDDEDKNNKNYVKMCLTTIISEINENVPFPIDTFKIDIENNLEYVMWPFSEQAIQDEDGKNIKKGNRLVKVRKGRKKNYLYIYNEDGKDKIELVGLPIMKANSTHLAIKIYNEVLKPIILKRKSAKFEEEFINKTLNEYLKREEVMKLMAREYKVNPVDTYKLESQIQAQISKGYFNGEGGAIELIKNRKMGNAGKGMKYCTVKEALDAKLTADDLDLTKVLNELSPFIKNEEKLDK